MRLFEPDKRDQSNDPYMINPKGTRVSVPESMVTELKMRGFVLEDKDWKPTPKKNPFEDTVLREVPVPRKVLLEEAQKQLDSLEVWEV